jgi:hypothetical protein
MSYNPDAWDKEALINLRKSQGWTAIPFVEPSWEEWCSNDEPQEWLIERLGPSVDNDDWSGIGGTWDVVGEILLISDPKIALLYKLTWVGK